MSVTENIDVKRGTTPEIVVEFDVDATLVDVLFLTIAQNGETVVEKSLEDGSIDGNSVVFLLTQTDTLLLGAPVNAQIQARGRIGGRAFASTEMEVPVARILKEGEI